MIIFWILAGAAAGLWISYSQRKTVGIITTGTGVRINRVVVSSALLRWLLAGAVLTAGFINSIQAGGAVFISLWVFRWVGLFTQKVRLQETSSENSQTGRR